MEKVLSTALLEQEKELEDGDEKAVLMTVGSNNEDLAALEYSQGEERIAVFLKDAKTPPKSVPVLEQSKEGGIGLKEAVSISSEKPEAMKKEGKVTAEMGSPKEDPSFLLPFSHQEPADALEACAVTDEPSPSPLDVPTITGRRKESCSKTEHRLKFRKGCYKADSRRSADQRSMTVLWDGSTQETVGSVSKEESTLERLPGLKDSESTKEVAWQNPSYSKEPTSAVESNIMKTVQMNTDDLEGELEHLKPGMAAGEASPPLADAHTVSGDERFHSNEPKQLDSFSKEHLDRRQEMEKKGFQRFDWLSEHNEGLDPLYRNINKPADVATNLSVKGQSAREASLLALPVFRRMLNPHLSKAKTAESAPSPRMGQAMDSDLGDVNSVNTAEWALQASGVQTTTDLAVRKHTWSIRGRDTVEHVPLRSADSPSCSTYDDKSRPYSCNLLLEEQGKDDVGQEEDPTVYTCIECSIYFKMKEHLMDHMLQHNRGLGLDQSREGAGDQCQLTCNECGWAFGDIVSLEQHRRLHQESREKIIEEIQKLNEFPDEGRDARLQCPKCVFGTNSSKVFVQHAKMHVRERKDQGLKHVNLFGNSGGSEPRDSSMHNIYRHFRPNEHSSQMAHVHSSNKGHSTCMLCSFPAPNDNILKEHMKYTHSHLPWNTETFEADMNQPGTSKDTYSPTGSSQFSESDYLNKADRLFPHSHCEIISPYDSPPAFPGGHQRLNKSNGTNKKEIPKPGFRARKRAPYSSSQKILEMSSLTSTNAYSPHGLKEMRNKSTVLSLDSERESAKSHPGVLEELHHKWLPINDVRSMEEEFPLATEIQLAENRYFRPFAIPQSALDLKRTFMGTLKAIDFSVASAGQQHQLRQMVPIVIVEEIYLYRRKVKRPKMKTLKKKVLPSSREFGMDESLPLGVFLLDSSLEGSLELGDLLDADSPMLKNEERKCPYCPDRFHNGIGLANHVRGHLNRVGVSYNVRHFISAEEVKAIEQKFSFQKKKKKGIANFDPSTFSLMRCEFCGAGFDTRAGLSSHARAHLRDFGITNWELTISPINILKELLANSSEHPMLQSALGTDPSSPNQDREMLGFRPCKSTTPLSECSFSQSPFSPFPPSWGDEPMQSFRDVMASEEEEDMVTAEMGSPPLQKKSSLAGSLDQIPNRIGGSLSPELSSSKTDSQDSKTPNLTTCEVCGTCFETRKGLSSHARSHLRQLGVAESESSGAPIDLLYELMKQKGKVDSGPISPSISKKSASPKEGTAGSTRPTLLPLSKAPERPQEPPVNKAIKSPPGFTPKNVSQPGSPILKKVAPALPGSPLPKNPEDKSPKLPLSPLQSSPKAQWPQPEEEGPLNLTVDSDSGRENDCQLCGAWFETRKGLSSHARAHLRHLGVSDPDAKGSPIDVLNDLIKSEDFKGHLSSLLPSERESLGETESSDGPSPKSTATAAPATGTKQAHSPRPLGKQPSVLSPQSPPPSKKLKPNGHRLSAVADLQRKQVLSSSVYWASDAEMAPLNLSSGAEPVRDIRCEFCGEYFENRKGLSSHARSHLRQMGVTEWYVNGSPIDTLREILKRRSQPRSSTSSSPSQGQKSVGPPVLGSSLEPRSPGEGHMPAILKKAQQPGSPMGHSPTSSPPPTARKIFSGLPSPSSLHKKLKQDQLRMEIKREMMSGGLHNDSHLSDRAWSPRDDMSPLNLSSRADPVRDIRCEFCGEFFENRKGLSSHARSHLRQMGVTEWSVNGSPIDTLREIIKKKNKLCLIKKEPNTVSIELSKPIGDEGPDPKSPGKMLHPMALSPLGGRTGKPNLGREVSLSPLKSQEGFLAPLSTKRPLSDERLSGHSELKQKTYIQTELPFKTKHMHEKPTHTSSEACCELCGLYFENRKALASHARAHLRQFGVTEWCVNGSPIETLSEWIKHRPQKAGAYRSYIQGGRPFTKKFRSASHMRGNDVSGKRAPLSLQAGSPSLASRSLGGEMVPTEASKAVDGGGGGGGERPAVTSPLSLVKVEEHQQYNINKFERRQAKPIEPPPLREEESSDVQQKVEEVRHPPPRVRPVPSLVPRPPQTSLVRFVGNIYTLKCRFCEVEFQGPLSIQEEWVRHLQRHILETNFSKADGLRNGTDVTVAPPVAEAQ
ncbi:protein Wiz isoform X3 [Sceloporus undulatus]|uniref:protein Wiz isoform X3 n=1 Tax=Sceloporus undulatus TaxID=8520 RepID=UPI001C4C0012|nr:protein Wiz isoform X3 [Sceloporus undulatus]